MSSLAAFVAFTVVLASPPRFVDAKERFTCLGAKGIGNLDLAWSGERFAVAWTEKSPLTRPPPPEVKPPDGPPPPRPAPRLPMPPPAPIATFETKVALLEPQGELVGESRRDVTPIDGASSTPGRLAFNGAELGLAWSDGVTADDAVFFRRLDKRGAPLGEPRALSELARPQYVSAITWNPALEQWAVLWTGTHGRGNVTAHAYLSRFRSTDSPGAPLMLDDDVSVGGPGSSERLLPRGKCFVTAWADYPSASTTFAEVCGDEVKRVKVSERGTQPMQVTLAEASRGYVVAWVDRLPGADLQADVWVARVVPDGAGWKVTAKKSLAMPSWAQSPSLAFDGASTWLAWTEHDMKQPTEQPWVARIRDDGSFDAPHALSKKWPGPTWARLAAGPSHLGLVVEHPNDPGCDVSFTPLAEVRR